MANSVIERLSNWMDVDALRAMANGLTLDLDTARCRRSQRRRRCRPRCTTPR
jgi:DNA gyrase subunit B